MKDITKTPRLYTDAPLRKNGDVALGLDHAHYLKSVLRLNEGDTLRLFNGKDGEWAARLDTLGKKSATASPFEKTRAQTPAPAPLHLLFAPIKKNRMDFLIEKAVELGATDIHPVITAHTENRKLNETRLQSQIIEAAEQCERLDIPTLHAALALEKALHNWPKTIPILWAAERLETAAPLANIKNPQAFLIGPEGGFNEQECKILTANATITPINLGPQILRAETAVLTCLSHAMLLQDTKK